METLNSAEFFENAIVREASAEQRDAIRQFAGALRTAQAGFKEQMRQMVCVCARARALAGLPGAGPW